MKSYTVRFLSPFVAMLASMMLFVHDLLFHYMARTGLILGANTLTNLMPSFYTALDVVSRELTGVIPGVMLDAKMERAAIGQTVYTFATRASAATDVTAAQLPPDDGDQTVDSTALAITKARRVPFKWNGEQSRGMNNGGPGVNAIQNDQIQQAIRTLINEMETDAFAAIRVAASRGYGTAGTTPFASDLSDTAQIRKILDDNGAPGAGRSLVMNTTAGVKVRTLAQLTKANEAGSVMTLRDGELLNIHGLSLRESNAVVAVTKGTGAAYTTSGTALAVGVTEIPLITGTGTVLAGDIVTFAGDTTKYVVVTGVAAPGTITIGAPGLRVAIPAAATAMTVGNTFTANVAWTRNALVMATRTPALPDGGDSAKDRTTVTDPRTGISFELSLYAGYRQMQYEVAAAWGVKGIKPEHTAILLG